MDALTTITVHFKEGRTEVFRNNTFADVVKELLTFNYAPADEPLKLHIESINKNLLFLAPGLRWYVYGERSFEETIELLWADGIYRNRFRLYTQNKAVVDPDSLWLRRGNEMILVDEDDKIGCAFNPNQFYEV